MEILRRSNENICQHCGRRDSCHCVNMRARRGGAIYSRAARAAKLLLRIRIYCVDAPGARRESAFEIQLHVNWVDLVLSN